MPQLETALPALLDGVADGRCTVADVASLFAERPARLHGLYPRKGTLQVGSDADFVVVDPDAAWRVDADAFEFNRNYSPYDGRTLTGRPVATYLRGRRIAEDMRTPTAPGTGEELDPGT